ASGGGTPTYSAGSLRAYKYGLDGSGKPSLSLAGTAKATNGQDDAYGFGSTAGVVTSNGLATGSALLWTVWSPNAQGNGAQLRAYDPVPVGGTLSLLGSWPV